jgi:hypothetical protein
MSDQLWQAFQNMESDKVKNPGIQRKMARMVDRQLKKDGSEFLRLSVNPLFCMAHVAQNEFSRR